MRLLLLFVVLCAQTLAQKPADTAYRIATVAGGAWCGDGRLAAAAPLGQPEGLAVDNAGNLYIADALDNRVRKIDRDGVIATIAGTGYRGFSGDGGPARDAQLWSPYGLLLDGAGNLYIADSGNHRVRKVSPDGVIRTVAGGGSPMAAADGSEARGAWLNWPRNLALASDGTLYISDFGDHRVYRVTPSGLIFRVAGLGSPGSSNIGDSVEAATAALNAPAGLAIDQAGALYVAESGSGVVRRIYQGRMTTVPGPPGLRSQPTGLALDRAGDLYVAYQGSARVMKLTPGPPRTIAGTGVPGPSGEGGLAVSASLSTPRDLVFDAAGNLYLSERPGNAGAVRKIDTTGRIATIAGDGTFRALGDGGPALFAHFEEPAAVALDAAGNLYVADLLAHRVRKVSAGAIATVAGTGRDGYAGDGGLAMAAQLSGPAGVAADGSGNLWIAETAGRVRRVSAAGIIEQVVGSPVQSPGYSGDGGPARDARLNGPKAIAADAAGNLYIADSGNHVIRKVTPDRTIATIVGKGVPGYTGDGGPAAAALLYRPEGLCLAPDGGLYIADTGNHVVRRVTASGAIVTIAGTGIPGFAGDGGPATQAQLNWPVRIALDSNGNLFIADSLNHRIRRVAPDGAITTIAGTGVQGSAGDDGPALEAQFNSPWDLAVDAAGNLFVADRQNQRIRKLSPSAAPVTPPPAVELATLVNAASLVAGPVAPGEIVTLFGSNLGPVAASDAQLGDSGRLAQELAGTQVLFNGQPAALLYVQYRQINLQAPYSIAGAASAEVTVRRDGAVTARSIVPLAEAAPGIFTLGSGTGQAAAYNEDRRANSALNAAARGTIVTFYATGEGQTNPPGIDGALATAPYPQPALGVALAIGGQSATVLYAGAAPGFAGLLQINARVPESIAPGDAAVELTVGRARSQPGVFLAVK